MKERTQRFNQGTSQIYLYSRWGESEQLIDSDDFVTPFQYVGAFGGRQQVFGGIYFRARNYDPVLGRWLTVDPLWPRQPAYAYAFGNPTGILDLFGHEPISLALNAFIPKRMGVWHPEPIPGATWEYKGDNRAANQPGTSRIGTRFYIDSCEIGNDGMFDNNTGFSHRRMIKMP